jgi:transposase
MDTSVKTPLTDSLGRRTGPRRKYSAAEKREIVEETLQPGSSVAIIAQRHGINANQVFFWRRLHRQGLLSGAAGTPPPLLPVNITTPTLAPTQRAIAPTPARESTGQGSIEIEFVGGQRLRIQGRVDRTTLSRVIDLLSRR